MPRKGWEAVFVEPLPPAPTVSWGWKERADGVKWRKEVGASGQDQMG